MKKVAVLMIAGMMAFSVPVISVSASSLDEVISEQQTESTPAPSTDSNTVNNKPTQSETTGSSNSSSAKSDGIKTYNQQYMDNLKDAQNLSEPSAGASNVNRGIKKVASFIVQILSYFVTALLVVRVLIDICYITLPFTRAFLANGYTGNGAAGGGDGMGGMGMNGMQGGMNGMGIGGMNGMGIGGMNGMNGMSRYGMRGGMGMNGMQGGMGQPGANPAMGRVQWVSNAALNAAAAESLVGPDGRAISPLKKYAKDMFVVLCITPILLVLAITGTLTNLGFLIGEMLVNAISGISGML